MDGTTLAGKNVRVWYEHSQGEVNEKLAKSGLGSDLKAGLPKSKSDALAIRNEIKQKRLSIYSHSERAQLAAQQAKVEQFRAFCELKRRQIKAFRVRARHD